MNYYQLYYFSDLEIEKANNNLIIISDKIKQLDSKLNNKNLNLTMVEINKMSMAIERLKMSKSCIKYYYNI
tara:strand:+ start:950 stop:1162 length:213 start_codon:yes stop_codon:yes gene_type:complete